MTLREQLALKIAESRKAYESGNAAEGDRLRQEAETMRSALAGLSALDGLEGEIRQPPIRPSLPGVGGSAHPGTTVKSPMNGGSAESNGTDVVKAAYIARFGSSDDYIRAILIDLHGPDYEVQYWAQKTAFNRYLRGGESALRGEDRKALSGIVMTPAAVKAALTDGIDSVQVLKSTMVEAVDTLGGYIVPVDFNARVIERLRGISVMRGRAFQMNTSRDAVEFPKATGGDSQYSSAVRVTWVDETPTAGTAETNLTWGLERIPVHTVMAETPISRNMVEDSAVNLEAYLAEKFAEAAAVDEDNRFLTGDGNGKPQGILPDSGNGLSLTEENSGNASALTFDGLIGLTYAIDAQYRQNAVFIAEKATYEAIAKLKDGQGQYLWRDRFGGNVMEGGAGRAGTLLGYAVLEQEAMPSIAANAYPLIFGDLRGYTIIDRVGMTVERYLDSQTARQNLIYYVMRRRLGGQALESWRLAVQKVAA